MSLVICQSPKGGTGTTFVAAQLAMVLAARGADVTLLAADRGETVGMHFGLAPAVTLPLLDSSSAEPVIAQGVSLRRPVETASDPDFPAMLSDLGYLGGPERVLVLDVPAWRGELALTLAPLAAVVVRVLTPSPDAIATIPALAAASSEALAERAVIALNRFDESRRLGRHAASFLRELVGSRLIGRIRQDEAVPEAMAMLKPLARYAPASMALADCATLGEALLPRLGRYADIDGDEVATEVAASLVAGQVAADRAEAASGHTHRPYPPRADVAVDVARPYPPRASGQAGSRAA